MKFYVASKYQERLMITKMMNELRQLGHMITCDWTKHTYSTPEVHSSYAVDDIKGVKDAFGVFINENRYRGALVELGAALALDKPVYIIGHAEEDCIFMLHPLVSKFDNWEMFCHELRGYC